MSVFTILVAYSGTEQKTSKWHSGIYVQAISISQSTKRIHCSHNEVYCGQTIKILQVSWGKTL